MTTTTELRQDPSARKPTPEQLTRFMTWRGDALDRMPYMARVLFAVQVLDAPGLGTSAVDARWRLYIDFAAWDGRAPRHNAEDLLHECLHLLARHFDRALDANVTTDESVVSNIAADCEINDDLRDAGCELPRALFARNIGANDYQTYEFYLAALRESGRGRRTSSSGGHVGCGSGAGGPAAPCELGSDTMGGYAPGLSDTEIRAVRQGTLRDAKSQSGDRGRGTGHGGLVELLEWLTQPPKVPWQQVLAAAVRRAVGSRSGPADVTYQRRNRRRLDSPFVMPGTYEPDLTITVVRDTSGSMSADDLTAASIEIEGIASKLGVRGPALRVLDVDTDVARARDYRGARDLAEVAGRGGTDMVAGITAAVTARQRPHAVVVITDGATPWPTERPRVPVVVCLIGSHSSEPPDWARVVRVD